MQKWTIWVAAAVCLAALLAGCDGMTGSGGAITDTSDFTYFVNISSENEWDLCTAMDARISFLLLSAESMVTVEDVLANPEEGLTADTVLLNFTGSCSATITRCSEEWMTEFPFWLYQTYRGVDWNEVAALAQAAQDGDADAEAKCQEYERLYLEDYEALTAEDLPQIYAYMVGATVTPTAGASKAAQYTSLPLTLPNGEMTVDVGILNISSIGWDQCLPSEGVDEDVYLDRLEDAAASYWGDGVVTLSPVEIADADHSQTLTGIGLYGIEGEILDIQVTVNGQTQSWDGTTPLEVPAVESASLTVTLQTQANQIVGYCEDANLMILRELDGKTQRAWFSASISQSWNMYELYAMMVDGLDISAYYAYSAGWEQPQAAEPHTYEQISFDSVSVPKAEQLTEDYDLYVTGAYYDDHIYALCLSAENHTEQTLTLAVVDMYINNYWYNGASSLSIELAPGETADCVWSMALESLAEDGITAQSGEDISSVEFNVDVLYDGRPKSDENGEFISCEEYACVYPMGEVTASSAVPRALVLETDEVRVYFLSLETSPYSVLRDPDTTTSGRWIVNLVIENISGEYIGYYIDSVYVDDISLRGAGAKTVRSGSCCVASVDLSVDDTVQSQIGEPETLTFVLTVGSNDTYTITVDLSEAQEG